MSDILEIKGITKSYTTGEFKQTALDHVNLNFRKNEFVAILGPSGSGKTTFLNIVGGLDRYDHGDMIINGKSTKNFKESEWDAYRNNSVGFIFQSYHLISHISIVDNVELGMTLSGVNAQEKHQKALEALESVGLKSHINKRPNQLSGGQMQRVAIARALANDPDIILADEPTGALDTQTSVQIMELIKDIANNKLVIMVTHNPELAKDYADRIVSFKDGHIIADSNPLKEEEIVASQYTLKKTSMSFLTALKLSAKNISTKKGRTALTAFASSIGIIGIALILSLSNGFSQQIASFEASTLSGFPIMIRQSTASMDMEQMRQRQNEMLGIHESEGRHPEEPVIYPYDSSEESVLHTNIFSDDYIQYIESINPSLVYGVSYTRLVNMNMLRKEDQQVAVVDSSALNFTAYPKNLDTTKEDYLKANYDLLTGEYPTKMTDLVLIVDPYNKLDQAILKELGLPHATEKIQVEDALNREFKVILNDQMFTQVGGHFMMNGTPENLQQLYDHEEAITLKIVGVIRAKEDTTIEVLPYGIAYSDELARSFIQDAKASQIVKVQEDAAYNVLTGEVFPESEGVSPSEMPSSTADILQGMGGTNNSMTMTKEVLLGMIGADESPYMITLYPTDFATKESVLTYLDEWNEGKPEASQIMYTDMAATFTSLSGGIMEAITLVLVGFSAVSLVVSLIMIGIITYISVLERTKEIGVLRALGARKKDITRVFNAETFIVGSCSGILGIIIAYVLTFPANYIIEQMTELPNVAKFNPVHAISLIIISILLTMLGGVIPASIAAKKDPVEALRSE